MNESEPNSIESRLPLAELALYESLVEDARITDIVGSAATDAWGIERVKQETTRSIKIARNLGRNILETTDVINLPLYQQAALAEAMDTRLRHRHAATFATVDTALDSIKTTIDYFLEIAEELQPIADAIHRKRDEEGDSASTLIVKLEDDEITIERHQIEELARNAGEPSLMPLRTIVFDPETGRSITFHSRSPVPVNDFYFNRQTKRFHTIQRRYILEPKQLTFDVARLIYDPTDTTHKPYSYGLIGSDVIAKFKQSLIDSQDPLALQLLAKLPEAED